MCFCKNTGYNSMKEKIAQRDKIIKSAKRIVIKVGTRLLTDSSLISPLVKQIAELKERGLRVILISSGAVGIGMKTLELMKRPAKLSSIQALAAIGQSKLMSIYERECAKYGFHAAQLLLTAEDLNDRERHLNVMNCINSLWNQGNLPIINENDSVSIDELKLGDNDTLAGLLAVMTRCDLTILLTTVDGLHTVSKGKLDKRVSLVTGITDEMKESAKGTDDSVFSIGGMTTKLSAAEVVTVAGEALIIADGRNIDTIDRIFKCEDIGTLFIPLTQKQMRSKQRWLNFFSRASGRIIVDEGAENAILKKGRSLLPSGIAEVESVFSRGDTVNICNSRRKIIAKGLSSYSSEDLIKIIGKQSGDIVRILGSGDDEAVHRNNLALVS
jgi:glutamate 5-kinase